ncbi:MAG: hypothetical protein DRP63_02925 [Planctomycetota bacterium]|nr:MAG: hypothetical protein DRP63_02925 [Planctomycetota bacterium]
MRMLGVVLVAAIFGGGGLWVYKSYLSGTQEAQQQKVKAPKAVGGSDAEPVAEDETTVSGQTPKQNTAEAKPASEHTKEPQIAVMPPQNEKTQNEQAKSSPKQTPDSEPFERLKDMLAEKDDAKLWKKLQGVLLETPQWLDACERLGKELLKRRRFIAWVLLSHAYRYLQDEKRRQALRKTLTQISGDLFYSFRPTPASVYHNVMPGDTLSSIQNDYVVPYPLIMRINGLTSTNIRIGQRLKIPVPPESRRMNAFVQVDKSEHTLSVFVSGLFVKCFKVGLGAEDRTPKGVYTITSKVAHPSWRGFPYGHPNNIIGDWWLGLSGGGVMGIGIHGTNDPESVGKDVSKGCVRMLNKDVAELATTVPRGTKVEIRD